LNFRLITAEFDHGVTQNCHLMAMLFHRKDTGWPPPPPNRKHWGQNICRHVRYYTWL